jgi:hypothetical protein
VNTYAYDENGRRRWVVIAGAALAMVVLLAVAFIAGRVSAPSGGAQGRAAAPGAQGGPGPSRVVNGVPVRYAHTPAGAVATATNYLMVIDGSLITQPDKYRAAIDTLAAPEARAKQESDAEKALTGFQSATGFGTYASQGRTVVDRVAPLAYHVDSNDGRTAQVSIWAEAILAVDGVLSLRETWSTSRVTVEWIGGDWKLSNLGGPVADSFGPVPTVVQAASSATSLPPQLAQYRSYQPDVG